MVPNGKLMNKTRRLFLLIGMLFLADCSALSTPTADQTTTEAAPVTPAFLTHAAQTPLPDIPAFRRTGAQLEYQLGFLIRSARSS
jgi:hypothetical protein